MKALTIRVLEAIELPAAAAISGRGLQDSPLHVAVLGRDPARRVRALTGIFTGLLRRMHRHGDMLGAFDGRQLLGVCAALPPGTSRPDARENFRLIRGVIRHAGFAAAPRALRWLRTRAARDPDRPHWHLGPLVVDVCSQGRGVGCRLMRAFCARMDALGEDAYLETDKATNVGYFEQFGFAVAGESSVLGVPNWVMFRQAEPVASFATALGTRQIAEM